jgi:hypothetical protein
MRAARRSLVLTSEIRRFVRPGARAWKIRFGNASDRLGAGFRELA